jgi:hypothetical protein
LNSIFAIGQRILDGVVQQTGDDGHLVETHLRERGGHVERMDQVGLPGEPLLTVVHLGGEDVRPLQEREVARGIVFEHPIGDVVEPTNPGCALSSSAPQVP